MPSVLEATRVQRSAFDGRYAVTLSGDWNAPLFPSGGVTTALALRAMQVELGDPNMRLRTCSTMFLSTVRAGRIVVDVEKLRLGKRMSHLRADVRSDGDEGPVHVTTAAFGETREGFDFSYLDMPDVPPPQECPGLAAAPPGVPAWRSSFFDNLDVRRVRSFASFEEGWEGGRAEAVRWMRYRVAPRLEDGRIDPLSLVALADTMPPAVGQYLGPGFPLFHAPSVDLNMHFFADSDDEWVLVKAVCQLAGDGYASADVALWDRSRRLVARGTQLMLLRFPEPAELGLGS